MLKQSGFVRLSIPLEGLRICLYANSAARDFLEQAALPGVAKNQRGRLRESQSSKTVLVFLHGFLDSSLGFRRILRALPEPLQKEAIVLLDLPGFGRSFMPALRELWHIDGMARMLARLLFGTLLLRKVVFVTHSMGGLLAAHIYLYQKRHFPKARILALHAISPALLRFSARDRNRIRQGFYTKDIGELQRLLGDLSAERKEVPPASLLLALLSEWSYMGYEYLALNTLEREGQVFFTEEQAKQLNLPVFLYWGRRDRMTPPRIAHRLQKSLSDGRLFWFSKAGHALHLEKPQEFLSRLEENLRE